MGTSGISICFIAFMFLTISFNSLGEGNLTSEIVREFGSSSTSLTDGTVSGTKWALLIAGSNGYINYRHQATICHAYHILKNGGLSEENIIVFMFDDIAYNKQNPTKGVISNYPQGPNLYMGVPKDYIGEAVNTNNFLGALLGNKQSVKGGSGKVLETGPNDHIFIYYAGYGGAGLLGMPGGAKPLFAKDLIDVLEKKHASNSYKKMVIYVDASESGSMFAGLLPADWNIYAVTSSNPSESSYATCFPEDTDRGTPQEYKCLGDLFSMSWMEDSDESNPSKETLEQQYVSVRSRTASAIGQSSHVMQYGDLTLGKDLRGLYMVTNIISTEGINSRGSSNVIGSKKKSKKKGYFTLTQDEATLFYLRAHARKYPRWSAERVEAQRELREELAHRKHIDTSILAIAVTLFGKARSNSILTMKRGPDEPVLDDWDCLHAMKDIYQAHCGYLNFYGTKYPLAFVNFCNAGEREKSE